MFGAMPRGCRLRRNTLTGGSSRSGGSSKSGGSGQLCGSGTQAFVVDTLAPSAPGFDQPPSPTAQRAPSFSGTGEAGATVHVGDGTSGFGAELCTGLVAADTRWACTSSVSLADGTYALQALQLDPAGNASPSATRTLVVDAHVPATPTLDALASPVRVAVVSLGGTTDPGTSLSIRDQGSIVRCALANVATTRFACDTAALPDGTYSFNALASTVTGVQSASSNVVTVTIDTTAPEAPVLDALPSPTPEHKPGFSGHAESLSVVDVLVDGNLACTKSADASGAFTCTPGSEPARRM